MHLFIADQQFAETSEPGMRDFDHPTPGRLTASCASLFAARAHVWRVLAIEHGLFGRAPETGIGTQMLAGAHRGRRATMASRTGSSWVTS